MLEICIIPEQVTGRVLLQFFFYFLSSILSDAVFFLELNLFSKNSYDQLEPGSSEKVFSISLCDFKKFFGHEYFKYSIMINQTTIHLSDVSYPGLKYSEFTLIQSSLLFGSYIFVIGGITRGNSRYVPYLKYSILMFFIFFYRMSTEIWDIESNVRDSTKLIDPILESAENAYYYGGLFLLSPTHCKKSGIKLIFQIFNIDHEHIFNRINKMIYIKTTFILDQFCIEIIQRENDENMIAIFHNGQPVKKTQRTAQHTYETCFSSQNVQNDIFRIVSKGERKVYEIS